MEFNALCTPLHHRPNTDNTRHTYVTAGHRQCILNTPPLTMTITTNSTTTTMKNSKNSTTSTTTTTTTTSNPGTTTSNSIMAQTTRVASFGHSVSFFFLSVFFLLLNNIYSNYDYIIATEGLREGGDKENGPKRRVSRCLGHSVSFFKIPIVFYIYTNYY